MMCACCSNEIVKPYRRSQRYCSATCRDIVARARWAKFGKTWRESNSELVNAQQRIRRRANLERARAYARVWKRNNYEAARASSNQWKAKNPAWVKLRWKIWYARNQENRRAYRCLKQS
jgi:hypothetical protein